MKRILLVSPFPPYIGGVSVSSQRLFDNLLIDGYEVEKYSTRYRIKFLNEFRLFKLLRHIVLPIFLFFHFRYDIIHFHISGGFLRWYISMYRNFFSKETKFVSTVHGDVNSVFNSSIGRKCFCGFDSVILVKKGDEKVLTKYYNGNIAEIPAFIPPKLNLSNELPCSIVDFLNDDVFRIVVNGAIVCNSNYDDLYGFMDSLILINKLIKNGIKVKLLILNLGNKSGIKGQNYINKLKSYIKDNNIEDYLFFYEEHPINFYCVLQKTDLFIRPTKTDGDALSIREALSLMVPTIASDIIYRPSGTIIYNSYEVDDLYNKVVDVMNNYNSYVDILSAESVNFYEQIKEQYVF